MQNRSVYLHILLPCVEVTFSRILLMKYEMLWVCWILSSIVISSSEEHFMATGDPNTGSKLSAYLVCEMLTERNTHTHTHYVSVSGEMVLHFKLITRECLFQWRVFSSHQDEKNIFLGSGFRQQALVRLKKHLKNDIQKKKIATWWHPLILKNDGGLLTKRWNGNNSLHSQFCPGSLTITTTLPIGFSAWIVLCLEFCC